MLSYNEFKEAVLAESVEQLDELSKGTLGSYMKKSADSAFHAQKGIEGAARKQRAGLNSFDASKMKSGQSDEEKARATKAKRVKGMNMAYKKLQKEEVEVLESLLAKLDEDEMMEAFAVHRHGGSIGSGGPVHVKTHETKEDAKEHAKRLNKGLSPGEKSYYGIKYKVSEVKGDVKEGYDVVEYSLDQLDEVHVSQKDWEEDQALKSRPSKFDAKYNGKPEAKSKHYVSQKDWEEDQALKSRPSKFDKKLTKEEVEVLESLLAKLEN
jgi:hypothetical protein